MESFTEAASKGHSSRDHSSYVRMEEEIQECTPEMIEKGICCNDAMNANPMIIVQSTV